jgi:hypothetical protein
MAASTLWQWLSLCVFPLSSGVDVQVLIFFGVCASIQPVISWRLYGMKFPFIATTLTFSITTSRPSRR